MKKNKTWNYDPQRGWLAAKRYADNTGPDYTHTPAGRLASRLWARGNPRLTTTYTYNHAGDLETVDYSDATPDITYSYDRQGRQTEVVQGGHTTRRWLDRAGNLLGEAYTGGPLAGLRVTNQYDPFLRRTNLAVLNSQGAVLTATAYSYDAASRLSRVSSGTATAGYFYLANSPLVSQIGFTNNGAWRMTTTKAYDSLNRLTEILSLPSGSGLRFVKPRRGEMFVAPGPPHPLSFGFSAARRHPRPKGARAFLPARRETDRAAPPKNWGMNGGAVAFYKHGAPLGLGVGCNRPVAKRSPSGMWGGFQRDWQVISGKKYWSDGTPVAGQQFEYSFDDIGNRTGTKAGGDENGVGLRSASYSANALNQYTSRDVPGAVDVMGVSLATNVVTVNGQGVYRKGEYFRKELTVNNASAPVWTNITVNAAGQASVSGNALLPKTPEIFAFDADGNLVQDGLWIYTWDAENRLVSMQSVSSVPSAAKLKLDFAYDHLSRRTQKVVSTWNASAYVPQYTNRFVYDGWNLAVTLASDLSPLASFTWGLDLSGSLHGAGGVGGLLWMTIPSGTNAGTYFYAYDGNGNVMALVNAADGSVAARYEYGPFGELLRATGPMARVNPFRFSTKYQDDETGLVYYGCRFYDPNTGRWPNRDPIGELGFQTLAGNRIRRVRDGNLYCFVGNNPLTRFDLHGLTDKDVQTIINTFLSTLKTMCGDGRCCPDIGWLQNVQACVPWSEREGCTAQAVHLYVAMYPLTQGGLDDKWYANTVQETTIPCLFYHNYVTMTPLTPQPEGPDGYIVDKITVDTWKGCYTITRRKMIFIEPNPQQSLWLWKNETKCFKCKDLKAGTAK